VGKYVQYDLNRDFVEIKHLVIKEQLSLEDIEDGIEPEEIDLKVAITDHAYKRMNDTVGRDCEWERVEELILEKGNVIFDIKNGEEFILVNDKQTLALVCQMHMQQGVPVLILVTVIRKIYIDKYNQEREKRVYIDKEKNKVY
jgi:hypothetical protein